ncbi:MAG: hypothetical protein JXB29_05985 [Sedimentisphaerales bacterium]|nr:hypothetical protein [Sedimentisphaerales bacterium]
MDIHKTELLKSEHSSKAKILLLGLIGLAGCVLIFVCTSKYGPGITPDSVEYAAAAESLLGGKGFLRLNGSVYESWPPLYPLLLALLKLCGVEVFFAARCLSALSFGLAIWLCGVWLLKQSGSLFLAMVCSVCILCSKPLFGVSLWAWSEPVFVLLIIGFFFALSAFAERPTLRRCLMLSMVTAAVCLTRYIGVVTIAVGGFVIIFNKQQALLKRVVFAILWSALSLFPLALWLLRNQLLTGTLMGSRYPSKLAISENITLAGNDLASWLLPYHIVSSVPGWIFFCLFCLFIMGAFVVIVINGRRRNLHWPSSPLMILLIFMALYASGILSAVTRVRVDVLSDRLLVPLYCPLVMLFLGIFALVLFEKPGVAVSDKNIHNKFIRLSVGIGIGLGLCLVTGTSYVLAGAQKAIRDGAGGINSKRWQESETIAWMRTHNLTGRIFSNDTNPIYILTQHTSQQLPALPSFYADQADQHRLDISRFISAVESEDDTYVVWFIPNPRTYLYDPVQLQQFCRLEMLQKFADGAVLAAYPAPGKDK